MSPERTLELPSRIRSLLTERLGHRRADLWFDSASTVRVESGRLAVDAQSTFAADWIRKNFGGDLRAVSQEALGRDDFELRVRAATAESHPGPSEPLSIAPAPFTGTDAAPAPRPRSGEAWRRLEDFAVGRTNRMAYEAVRNFASNHSVGNGLVLHGSCGVGKTHLLQGLCRQRRESRTQQRVRYITAEQFTNEYIQSVRHGTIDAFRARVRRVDLLAIDDVHFLAGKTATQNEFLHTLDAVQLSGSQVAIVSDEHPHLVRRLSQSLISRMIAGMVVRIDPPDLELRLALVRSLALRRAIDLSEEAAEAIAQHCAGGAREIEGTFASLEALRSNQSEPAEITRSMVDVLFRRAEEQRGTNPVRLTEIIDQVCTVTGVEMPQLAGAGRHRRISLARALIAWLARRHTSMSFPEIARSLGRTSHSAIHTGAARIDSLIEAGARVDAGAAGDCRIVELLDRLRHELRNSPKTRRS
ncbi:MAG: ATP-binding protein [Planctomycetes bacterium]|nr:ATP-binding protein [Planctomycetota bacterium]